MTKQYDLRQQPLGLELLDYAKAGKMAQDVSVPGRGKGLAGHSRAPAQIWGRLQPGQYYRESGITRQAQATKTWPAQVKPQLKDLSQVSSRPSSLASYRRFPDTVLATYDAMWAEVSKPRWANARGVPVSQMLKEAVRQFPAGRVVMEHEFRTSRVSSAYSNPSEALLDTPPESFSTPRRPHNDRNPGMLAIQPDINSHCSFTHSNRTHRRSCTVFRATGDKRRHSTLQTVEAVQLLTAPQHDGNVLLRADTLAWDSPRVLPIQPSTNLSSPPPARLHLSLPQPSRHQVSTSLTVQVPLTAQPPGQPPRISRQAAALLTRTIKACKSWQELQHLYLARFPDMDFIHLAAALTHLAQLQSRTGPGVLPSPPSPPPLAAAEPQSPRHPTCSPEDFALLLLQDLAGVVDQLRARELANVVWAAAKLLPCPDPSATAAPTSTSRAPSWQPTPYPTSPAANGAHAGSSSNRGCSSGGSDSGSSHGSRGGGLEGSGGGTPGIPGLPSCVSLLLQRAWIEVWAMGPQELSNTLYATALLQAPPPGQALGQALSRLIEVARDCSPQALANISWALPQLKAQPGGAVLRVLLRETYRHMYDLTPQVARPGSQAPSVSLPGLCGVTHGLVGLGVVLPQQWVRKLLDAAWQRMRVRAQGPLPPPSTQASAAGDPPRQQQHQQGWQSSGATATISTGEERRAGGGEKARGEAGVGGGSGAWPAMSGGVLQPSLPQPLAAAAAAPPGPLALPGSPPSPQLSEAQQVPGRRGGPGYAGRLAARDCLDVTSLVRLLWALVKASHAPPRAWLAGCLVQVEAEVGELTAADVAQLMWCLAQMQVRPSLPLLAQLMARGYATLQELPPEGLVALVWALGQLGARPSAVWAERALKSVYRLAPSMGCWGCCSLLWSLGLLQLRPSLKLVTALLAAARQQLEEAASRGEGGPGTSLVPAYGHLVCSGCSIMLMFPMGAQTIKCSVCHSVTPAPDSEATSSQPPSSQPTTIPAAISQPPMSQLPTHQPHSSQPPTSQPPSSQPPVSQLPVDPAWAKGGRQPEGEAVPGPVPAASPPQSSPCRPSTAAAVDKDQGELEHVMFTRPKPAEQPDKLASMGKEEGAVNPLAHLDADWLGCDPGKPNMATVAHEERYPSGAVKSVWHRRLTSAQYYRQSGITEHAKTVKGAEVRCNSTATGRPLALAYGAAGFSGSGSIGRRGVPVKQMRREACKQFPGGVVLVHEFRTSRVSSARTNVVAGQAESFRWLHPVRSMATWFRIQGLMCSTSNVIKRRFYDRDVSAALNIRRIAAGPGRPRELSSWLGRPAMPNPGRPGQEWVQVRDKGLLRKWQRRHQRQR
ncbi:hypothetical protein QJQ45_014507 [Haematococcus lacustris]|nr:hypothetical protein QJQ45_014507 [Haematococcus lacustris]